MFLHRDESLSGSELTSKLEPAFLAGLRCVQPATRKTFFEVFDSSVRRSLFDRILYITCSQNWEAMGSHYWIKQCIEVRRLRINEKVVEADLEINALDLTNVQLGGKNLFSVAISKHFLPTCRNLIFNLVHLQLLFSVCDRDASVIGRGSPYTLPSVTHVITMADAGERAAFEALARVKTEPMEIEMDSKEEVTTQLVA